MKVIIHNPKEPKALSNFYKNPQLIKDLNKLHKKLYGDELPLRDNIGVFCENDNIIGYITYSITKNNVIISWIYGPNYGKIIMKHMEKIFKRTIGRPPINILLNISVDPTENKTTIMKRINFYIGLKYKVIDIKFRDAHGPLFYMRKII